MNRKPNIYYNVMVQDEIKRQIKYRRRIGYSWKSNYFIFANNLRHMCASTVLNSAPYGGCSYAYARAAEYFELTATYSGFRYYFT